MPPIQSFRKNHVPEQPDNVYYDLIITNIQSEKTEPVRIYYNQNRTNPIIDNTGQYELSIIRFSVDTQLLPVFIPFIKTGLSQTDPNLTIYSVSLSYLAPSGNQYYGQAFLEWSPQDTSAPVPPPPSANNGFQSTTGNYYYCYNYTWWCYIVLNAFKAAYATLEANVVAGGDTFPNGTGTNANAPPTFTFDTTTQTAVLSAPSLYYNNRDTSGNLNPQAIGIYFNNPLYQLFSSFAATYRGVGAVSGTDYRILVDNFGGTSEIILPTIPVGTGIIATQVFQEYSTTSNWTPVSGIVFTSNTIPIVPNGLSAPLIFNEASVVSLFSNNNANFAQIITDLETNENCYKPNLLYEPTAEYRFVSLVGTSPLTNIDVSVYWKTRLGELVPLYLPSGGSATLKFLFRKRIGEKLN
jgi:hypothetical protein